MKDDKTKGGPYNFTNMNGTEIQDANKAVTGYTFTAEGKNTQTLYIKDEDNGYIGTPVAVTVQIDKTAPVWEDADGNADKRFDYQK